MYFLFSQSININCTRRFLKILRSILRILFYYIINKKRV